MSKFVLTAQLQLQAPNNVRQVVNQIQGQLAGVNVPINVQNAASATRQINQIRAATNDATTAAERMGTAFGVSLKRFASFSIATRAVGLFTNGLAGAIRDAIAFERELIKVAQVSNQSISSLKGLTSTITELATSLGVESKSLLEVSTILKQAGLSANDTSIALKTLAKAALAPNFDSITETTEGAIAILAQFGLGVQALEGQLSSVDAVAGAFAVEAGDLIDVIRRAGGVFKSSGGDLNELIALFTSVRATTRESAESIGTGLRTIFTRIQRPQTIKFLKQFGVELVDLEGKFVGPFEAVKRLSAALAGLGEGDLTFIRVAEELGGFRQIGKVLPLLQQFALAQEALNVAQNAGNGLTQNAVTAQQALAIRITKVKEEFLAFIRGVTESRGFQLFVNTALNLASAFIKIGEALTPVIPLLTAMMAINISRGIGSFLTSIPRGLSSNRFSGGGRVLGFEKGGMVPGVGNKDTVPAMLTPGEVVMNRSAVQKYGAGNLVKMNNRAKGGPITVEELKAINPNSVQPDYRNEQLAKFKTGENDNTWSKYKMDGKLGKVRTTAIKYMQPNDKVFGEVNYIPVQDPNRVEVEKYFGNISFPRGTKFINPKDKKIATAYEAYVESKMEGIGARFTGTYDPLDFETGDAKFYSSEENIEKYASINKVLSKRLRHENVKKRIDWNPSTPETKELQTTNIYHPTDLSSNNNLKSRLTEWLLLNQSQRTSQAIKAGQNFNIGGLVQRFEEGGVAQRRIGIIDTDVFRDKENASRVSEGMKLLGAESEADYGIKLSKLAGEARQSGSLSKFSVMAGAAANRKSSLATGRGAKDDATLRKTTRKHILHPDDLKDVDQVMSLTTTLKDSKLDYMGMADRIYSKDSSTEDEQKLVKLFERQRNLQKDPTLYGRETGTTEGLNPDYGLQTASLISQFGTTEDRTNKGKVMTLGEKTDQSGAPRFQVRRKRLEELPELVSAKGQFPGAASPLTRGHAETAVGTLLAKVREKYPDATHKDLLFALAPDLSLSGGSQGREHGSRYGEYPASFRRDLIKLALPEMMISSANSPSETGINSRIAEIEKGATGRRRFAVMEKDAPVVISKAENENPEGVMERYRAAGLTPYNIARSADTEGDSISGTATRQAVIDKDYAKLDLAVLPQVGSAIKANQPQLRNRRMMVPLVQQALDIFTQANASKINEQVDGILQNASGGPFTRMTPKFKEAHPNLVKQIQQLRKNRDIFERESFLDPAHELIRIISNRYPDIYGLDVARKEPVDVSITEDMIKQHIVDSSKLSSYFKPGLSFSGDGIQLSPTLQKVKDAVEKEVKSEVAAEPTLDKEIVAPSSRADIFKVLSRDEAAIASGVDKIKTYDIMGLRRELTAEEQRIKDAVKDAYVQKVKNKSRAAKATTTKLRGKGLEFGAAGLFGKAFAAKNIKIESDKLSSSRMVRVMSGVMDQATATRLSTTMSKGVSDIVSQGTNIVKSGSKQTALATSPIQNLNTNTNATIQGGLIEQIIQQLGGPGAVKGKGFDFPDGLQGAAKYFNIDPNIPTDVKRTLSGPLTIKDNIVTYLKNVMGYASGGLAEAVPALVSNGEAYVPPAMAKKIGYGRLNRMNQADRNGMGRFSEGGISVFKGPGTGTSDSIPANLPVGSFIVRAKATKALGLNKGGKVKKFAAGGGVYGEKIGNLYDVRATLKEQAKTATGNESLVIAQKLKEVEKEMDALVTAYSRLADTIDQSTKDEESSRNDLDKANDVLLKRLEKRLALAGNDEEEKKRIIEKARSGGYRDKKGNDILRSENLAINRAENAVSDSRSRKDIAKEKMEYRFGGQPPGFDAEARRRGNTPFPYPTPQGGTSASGGSSSPPSGGPSSGGDVSEDSRQGFNKLTNVLSIASASLNGLIQTVDGSGSAFTNGISGILGSVTTLSSSFSVLEELTGQQINSVSDFLALNQTTGKSFAGIDENGNKKEGGIADLIEKNLGSGFFGKLTTNLTVGVGNMIGAFSQGAAAFQLVSSTLLSFNTTQAQLDSAIKSGNVELAGSLAVQNDTIKDITSAGGYVAGGIAVVAQGLASLATIFPALVPTFAAIAAPVVATIGPFIAIAAAIALATGAILALTGNFDIVTNSFIYLRDTIRDVASYLAGLIGIQVDTAEQANKKSKTKAELESSNARIQNLAQAQQREQNLSLDLFSKGKIDTKEAFKPFNDEAKAVLDNQKISRERMQVLQETNVNGKNDAEINALKNESRKTFDDFEKKASPIIDNSFRNSAVAGQSFDDAFKQLPQGLQEFLKSNDEYMQTARKSYENLSKSVQDNIEKLKSLNFGLDPVISKAKATSLSIDLFNSRLQVGGASIVDSVKIIEAGLTNAASNMDMGQFNSAVNQVGSVMASLGASEAQVKDFTGTLGELNNIQSSFGTYLNEIKNEYAAMGKVPSPDDLIKSFKDKISQSLDARGVSPEVKKRIMSSLKGLDSLSPELREKVLKDFEAGNLQGIIDMFGPELAEEMKKQMGAMVEPLIKANDALVKVINERVEAEKNLVSAQREAIDLSLEGMQIQAKYGGSAVTPEIRRQAALESANAGRRRLGLEDIRGSNPNALRAGLNQTRLKFAELEQKRVEKNPFGPQGAEDEAVRSGLKDAQKDQVKLIRDLVAAEEEQLKITKEKNKLEKDSLESLLAGDIDKFFEQQAAVGATAAIASGNRAAIGQFGGQALGGAYQNLQRQKEAGVTELFGRRIGGAGGLLESSAMASLGARGVQNPRMAQILAGTTPEEEASNRRLREYGGLLGEAGAAGAEMAALEVARAEINVAEAKVNFKNAGGDLLNNQPQGKSRGGIVYASKGQLINFVPKGTDTVPAMLTPGEFVVNRGAVNRGDNLSFLRAINNGQYTANAQRLNSNTSSIPNILKQLTSSPQSLQTQDTQRKVVQNERNISNVNFDVQKLSKELGKFMSGFDGFMENFSEQVGKLGNTEVSHKLGDVNLNINGGQFLQSMADGLKQQLMEDLGQKLQGIKVNNVGNIKFGRTSVL